MMVHNKMCLSLFCSFVTRFPPRSGLDPRTVGFSELPQRGWRDSEAEGNVWESPPAARQHPENWPVPVQKERVWEALWTVCRGWAGGGSGPEPTGHTGGDDQAPTELGLPCPCQWEQNGFERTGFTTANFKT